MCEFEALTAVDILLEPDMIMLAHATVVNERLLATYPDGFALDTAHRPHITMVQRYVDTDRLADMYAAIQAVFEGERVPSWEFTAIGYYYIPWKDLGLAGITIQPTPELVRLQRSLLEAVRPFTVQRGVASAFHTTADEPEINQPTLDYVAAFEENSSGARFNPHVSVGLAPKAALDALLADQFSEFTFSVMGAAAYQLGNFGTAAKQLQTWPLGA